MLVMLQYALYDSLLHAQMSEQLTQCITVLQYGTTQ